MNATKGDETTIKILSKLVIRVLNFCEGGFEMHVHYLLKIEDSTIFIILHQNNLKINPLDISQGSLSKYDQKKEKRIF